MIFDAAALEMAMKAAEASMRERGLAKDGEIWIDRDGKWWNHPNAKEEFVKYKTVIILNERAD